VQRSWGPDCNFFLFLRDLCVTDLWYSCPLYSTRMYLCVYPSLYGIF
jgi:hypothetical protein